MTQTIRSAIIILALAVSPPVWSQPTAIQLIFSAQCPGGGLACLVGPKGATGAQGPAGAKGATGATGNTGAQGVPGAAGTQGVTGPQGAPGANGAVGPAGPAGPQGIPGSQGVPGATGAAGPQGPAGPMGPAGPAGNGPGGTSTAASGPPYNRMIGNCPVGLNDMYYNSPVNLLPLDPMSAQKIASLATAPLNRLNLSPEFKINVATASTPIGNMVFQTDQNVSDGGTYLIDPTFEISQWVPGVPPTLASNPTSQLSPNTDAHLLVLNQVNCQEYEIFGLQTAAPPYMAIQGVIFDLMSHDISSTRRLAFQNVNGKTSADASGQVIGPLVYTHAEIFSSAPIWHGGRLALDGTSITVGAWQWPGDHFSSGTGTSGILFGTTFRLPANYDTTTCHNNELAGQPFPAAAVKWLTALKIYGLYLSDKGTSGLYSTDSDQAWNGNTGNGGTINDQTFMAQISHCVKLTELEIVDNAARIVDINSGQIKPFTPR